MPTYSFGFIASQLSTYEVENQRVNIYTQVNDYMYIQ